MGTPHFYFEIQVPIIFNNQYSKFDKNLSAGSISMQWPYSAYDPKNKSFQKYANLKGFLKQSKMVFFLSFPIMQI